MFTECTQISLPDVFLNCKNMFLSNSPTFLSLTRKRPSISVISFLLNFIMLSSKFPVICVSTRLLLFYFRRLFLFIRILFSMFLISIFILPAQNSASDVLFIYVSFHGSDIPFRRHNSRLSFRAFLLCLTLLFVKCCPLYRISG
jgi:hypothetical protein